MTTGDQKAPKTHHVVLPPSHPWANEADVEKYFGPHCQLVVSKPLPKTDEYTWYGSLDQLTYCNGP